MPRIGRVKIAHGRDAVDVALSTSYGTANLTSMIVWADEIDERGEPTNLPPSAAQMVIGPTPTPTGVAVQTVTLSAGVSSGGATADHDERSADASRASAQALG